MKEHTMTGKATTKRRGGKRRMSEAERERRAAEDKRLRDAADEVDDEALADFIAAHPGLERLSEYNVALLYIQAIERDTDISDVRTYRQWAELGRQVNKGAKAYRLVVPRGKDAKDEADSGQDRAAPEEREGKDGERKQKMRYYLKAGWFDIGDTSPAV